MEGIKAFKGDNEPARCAEYDDWGETCGAVPTSKSAYAHEHSYKTDPNYGRFLSKPCLCAKPVFVPSTRTGYQ